SQFFRLEVESLEKNIKKLKVEAELLEDQISKLREIIFQSVTDRASHSIPGGIGV
uniref:Transposase n=1 Tax=Ascaris lumbricoides TaxID=6252 RepID=A0A0M3IMP9_ASCLU